MWHLAPKVSCIIWMAPYVSEENSFVNVTEKICIQICRRWEKRTKWLKNTRMSWNVSRLTTKNCWRDRCVDFTRILRAAFANAGCRPSLYAAFLFTILCICNREMAIFLEPILKFIVILGLFIWEFIIFEPISGAPISRI